MKLMDWLARLDAVATRGIETPGHIVVEMDPETVRLVLDVVRAAQDYSTDRVNAMDRTSSWQKEGEIIYSLDRLAAHVEGKETG